MPLNNNNNNGILILLPVFLDWILFFFVFPRSHVHDIAAQETISTPSECYDIGIVVLCVNWEMKLPFIDPTHMGSIKFNESESVLIFLFFCFLCVEAVLHIKLWWRSVKQPTQHHIQHLHIPINSCVCTFNLNVFFLCHTYRPSMSKLMTWRGNGCRTSRMMLHVTKLKLPQNVSHTGCFCTPVASKLIRTKSNWKLLDVVGWQTGFIDLVLTN